MKCSTRHFYEFGPFRLDPAERLLLREGQPVALTPKAFETLLLLVQRSGHLVGKDEFIEVVWRGAIVGEDSLARNIAVLRKALGEGPKDHKYIETVPGHGYRFVARVEEKCEKDAEPDVAHTPATAVAEPKRSRMPWFIFTVSFILIALIFVVAWLVNGTREPQQYVLALEQPAMRQISSGAMSATRPMVSPDGKSVLYVADSDLYLAPVAGGNVLRITNNAYVAGDMPVFTADGVSIVFSRYRDGEDGSRLPDLWIVPSPGGTPRRFIAEASGAHFSPDGKWVAYTKHFPDKKPLWISPLDRLEERREVTDLGLTPRWSPDGKWIAYTTSNPRGGDGVLWVVSASVSERRQMTKEPKQIYGLTWSADSGSLIFASGGARRFNLYQVSLAGDSVKPVTTGVGDYLSPSVSPDGKTLIFCHASNTGDLFVTDGVGNTEVKSVTRGEYHMWPRLSPSSERVASVVQRPDFNEYLYVTDLKTGKSARLSDRIAHHPCWLDEGHLAYLSFDASAQKTEVRVVNLATGVNSSWINFPCEANWLAVHPDREKLAVVLKSPEGRQKVVLRDLENQSDLTLAEGAEYEGLRWSSDGAALSWSGPKLSGGAISNGVWVVEPGRGQPRRLVPDGYGPTWSADGTSIYFFRYPDRLWHLDMRRNVLTKVRSWGFDQYDLIGERLVFVQISYRSQVYAMMLK